MTQTAAFNPNEHLMQIKSGQSSKDYLEVKWRLVWFRDKFPQGTIETEMLVLDLDRDTEEETTVWVDRKATKVIKSAKGFAVFKATVKDGQGGIGTGTKSEKAASFGDYIEKAESGAIGRALAALGFGTQFTGDELSEAHRIVDSPVEREQAPQLASQEQITTLIELHKRLNRKAPEDIVNMEFIAARKLILALKEEYKASRPKAEAAS